MTARTLLAGLAALLLGTGAQAAEFTANRLFVANQGDDRVVVFGTGGKAVDQVGASTALIDPAGLAFGPDGRLWVSSAGDDNVYAFDATGALVATLEGGPIMSAPRGLAIGADGSILVADSGNDRVLVFDPDGTLLAGLGQDEGLDQPVALALGPEGHLFVGCAGTGRVHVLDRSGTPLFEIGAGSGLVTIGGLLIAPDGRLLVSSETTDSVLVFDAAGTLVDELGEGTDLDTPGGLAYGPDGLLAVVSQGGDEVLLLDADGAVADSVGGSALSSPTALAFAPFRFPFSAKGSLVREGQATVKLAQTGVLSVATGSGPLLLALDDPEGTDDLVDVFGDQALVFWGFTAFQDLADKKREALGAGLPDATGGVASLALTLNGKLPKKSDVYELKKGKGLLVRAGAEAVFMGKAKVKKALNK